MGENRPPQAYLCVVSTLMRRPREVPSQCQQGQEWWEVSPTHGPQSCRQATLFRPLGHGNSFWPYSELSVSLHHGQQDPAPSHGLPGTVWVPCLSGSVSPTCPLSWRQSGLHPIGHASSPVWSRTRSTSGWAPPSAAQPSARPWVRPGHRRGYTWGDWEKVPSDIESAPFTV